MYQLLRTMLFLFPPEGVHYFSMRWLKRMSSVSLFGKWLKARYGAALLNHPVSLAGLLFRHPVGLAAGFDKNASFLAELELLGFSCVEIGTVTPRPQDGNPQPRLFRLPEDKALINRMGFNNEGSEAVAERLKAWRLKHPRHSAEASGGAMPMIIGGNIGKNKTTPNEHAYMDYDICFRRLVSYVDYFVVNVSSPNTPGLRELQEKESLRKILVHLQEIRISLAQSVPIFLKIAPDLTPEQIDDVAQLALEINLDGLVATNTTLARSQLSDAGKIRAGTAGDGGLSGAPVNALSTQVIQRLQATLKGRIPIIASGGVFTQADAKEKIHAGAQMVQVWTGFVYEGPAIVKKILKSW